MSRDTHGRRRGGPVAPVSPAQRGGGERALLVATVLPAERAAAEEDLRELRNLAETAGLAVVTTSGQLIRRPNPKTFVGEGKVEELRVTVRDAQVEVVVFDAPLSPAQQRNLERTVGVKVVDRQQLILDIFARRARSNEGKLQVELAQLQYLLPRLTRHWGHLSRLGGGVGTRGPGETQLEVDRRRARERIAHLRQRLRDVERTRRLHRDERRAVPFPCVALVGYTNAGKSTLMNALTHAGVLVEDKLFATLDPTVRRLTLPAGETVMLIDTVGFINKLPPELVEAFKGTLEEVRTADLLLHVVDVSSPHAARRMQVVDAVLREIGADDRPVLVALNKTDRVTGETAAAPDRLPRVEAPHVGVSALTGANLPALLEAVQTALAAGKERVHCTIPNRAAHLHAWVRAAGRIVQETYHDDAVELTVLLSPKAAGQLRKALRASLATEGAAAGSC